jgi:hypothetical protein
MTVAERIIETLKQNGGEMESVFLLITETGASYRHTYYTIQHLAAAGKVLIQRAPQPRKGKGGAKRVVLAGGNYVQ